MTGHDVVRFAPGVRILSVVGNRPQFIKSLPVSLALRDQAEEITLHTGQHYDEELSQVFYDDLELNPPDYRLEAGSGTHAEQTARMLPGIERAVLEQEPVAVLVFGDTNSTLAGALAAAKLNVPVAHVEAGLRAFDPTMPEELNRIVVDRISALLFCPTENAVANLEQEGIAEGVLLVGDVMLDANRRLAPRARERSSVLEDNGVEPGNYVVVTLHREANMRQERLAPIAAGLSLIAEPVIFAAHPRARTALAEFGLTLAEQVRLTPGLGYLDFASLASQARVIVTDSGGLQKEAYWYGVPCVTVRDSTEWIETVETGWNKLVPPDAEAIAVAVDGATTPASHPELYGDGFAAERIVEALATIGAR